MRFQKYSISASSVKAAKRLSLNFRWVSELSFENEQLKRGTLRWRRFFQFQYQRILWKLFCWGQWNSNWNTYFWVQLGAKFHSNHTVLYHANLDRHGFSVQHCIYLSLGNEKVENEKMLSKIVCVPQYIRLVSTFTFEVLLNFEWKDYPLCALVAQLDIR